MAKHKHAAVIKAWADGAEIECRTQATQPWVACGSPEWYKHVEYRVVPETCSDAVVIEIENDKVDPEFAICTYTSKGECFEQIVLDNDTDSITESITAVLEDFYSGNS
jgi:hypothetical protein